ncbi:hypothetical protein Adu01nite_94140 [Paractinoplanes durhamensis]|uniref:Uncharacterized protein n=1 Tax=Paractinoplanes durhamensis TaxID=113563 RepID=A0ABQ3ZE00_9ACTN|nr:hypothetical protein Adu01nite_94140 [Actinoplanes durhamensis]
MVCGKDLPVGVRVLPHSPGDWAPCPACKTGLRARLEKARKRGLLDTARQEKIARRAAAKQQRAAQAAPLSGADLRRAWRSPGWVALADRKRAHHPNPQLPGHVLCGRQLDPGIPAERQMPVPHPCARCVDVLRRQQENLGLRTIMITTPADVDRYERARRRGTSIRALRGGLPTLGRDR